jgi:plasmid maintenance system antidote protein VapI
MKPTPPGATLAEMLAERDISARRLGWICTIPREQVTAILRGEAPITEEIARKLGAGIGPSAVFWIERERLYREALGKDGGR